MPTRAHAEGDARGEQRGSDGRWLGPVGRIITSAVMSPFVSQTFTSFVTKPNGEDLALLRELIEDIKVTPVIDRRYPLSEVPDAIRYLERRHTRGKVIITV